MLRLYNTLTRKKEIFKPIKKDTVSFYACGPTVYDRVHIGNLRTYVFEDILKKTLEYNNYQVKYVMNITDIEDKIVKKMKDENKTLKEATQPYIDLFFKDIKKLNITEANHYPKATEHIKEMIKLIETLLEKGIAYKGNDNSIYFDIKKFKNYGALSQLKQRKLKHGARIKADEYNKENIGDFVLWKATIKNEPSWDAPFGKGRPGWHIECSAMSSKYLGKTFDIHAGAVDLIFPHHENEIAQSEAANDKKFVNYWIEGEHLLVNNQKMSKSLQNFYTIEDIKKKNFLPLVFRYLIISAHYRSKLNFTWESLKTAQNAYKRLKSITLKIKDDKKINKKYLKEFENNINNDLNMPKALALLWNLIRDKKADGKYRTIEKIDQIFSLDLFKKEKIEIPQEIKKLLEKREQARKDKNFNKADKLRKEIKEKGFQVEDTPKMSKVRP
ncbi:MAG: cysteine--tRNA ligase [Patescibacteria group bacterium]